MADCKSLAKATFSNSQALDDTCVTRTAGRWNVFSASEPENEKRITRELKKKIAINFLKKIGQSLLCLEAPFYPTTNAWGSYGRNINRKKKQLHYIVLKKKINKKLNLT